MGNSEDHLGVWDPYQDSLLVVRIGMTSLHYAQSSGPWGRSGHCDLNLRS